MLLETFVAQPAAGAPAGARDVLVMEAEMRSAAAMLAEKPTRWVQYAALELRHDLQKITSQKPPVARERDVPAALVRNAVTATALEKGPGFPRGKLLRGSFLSPERAASET